MEEEQRSACGWAARDESALLSPYSYKLRSTGPEDVYLKVICCGICHSDLHLARNDYHFSNYPLVPGHEVVGEVMEIGSEVKRVGVGDYVGVGYVIGCCKGCDLCNSEDYKHYCDKNVAIFNHKYPDGKLSHGGFADALVVDQSFVIKIPKGMAPERVAPLLCSGITAYSPMVRLGLKKSGLRCGILGLGGIGHVAVMIAKSMGHHVTVISSSEKKREEALEIGADVFLVSSEMSTAGTAASLDYVIDTVPVFHQLEPLMNLLKVGGKLVLVGGGSVPLHVSPSLLHIRAITIAGSFIGSVSETEELINLFHDKGLSSKVEVIKMDYVNTAFHRLQQNDVKFKFIIDVAGSNLLHPSSSPS